MTATFQKAHTSLPLCVFAVLSFDVQASVASLSVLASSDLNTRHAAVSATNESSLL